MEELPPLSLPIIVILVVVVLDKELFGINLNLLPMTTCEACDAKSPVNAGMVAEVEFKLFVSVTTKVPTFLLDNIAVYPNVTL
jgi:hypothetical protein